MLFFRTKKTLVWAVESISYATTFTNRTLFAEVLRAEISRCKHQRFRKNLDKGSRVNLIGDNLESAKVTGTGLSKIQREVPLYLKNI